MIRAIENRIRKRFGAAPAIPGEGPHLPHTNYCGPGTNIAYKDRFGPTGPLDKICQRHDYIYQDSKREPDAQKRFEMIKGADEVMLAQIDNLPPTERGIASKLARAIIGAKSSLEGVVNRPIYAGHGPIGVPQVVTVKVDRKQPRKIVGKMDEILAPARRNRKELEAFLIANADEATRKSVFFRNIIKDLDKNTGGIEQKLSLMPDDQLLKFVTQRTFDMTRSFVDELSTQRDKLEALKRKMLASARYRDEPLKVRRELTAEMNRKIKELNSELATASSNFKLMETASVPVSRVVETDVVGKDLIDKMTAAAADYDTADELMVAAHDATRGRYIRDRVASVPDGLANYLRLFGKDSLRIGRAFDTMRGDRVRELEKVFIEARDKAEPAGVQVDPAAIFRESTGDGEIAVEDFETEPDPAPVVGSGRKYLRKKPRAAKVKTISAE